MPADEGGDGRPRARWSRAGACGCVGVVLLLLAAGVTGSVFLLRAPLELALGWLPFLRDVGDEVTVNPAAVGMGALCLGLFLGGVHWLGGWLWPALRPEGGPWRGRWTGGLGGLVVVAFAAGTAAVGVVHQAAWLATSPEPLVESSWGGRGGAESHLSASALRELVSIQGRRAGERPGEPYATLAELVAEGRLTGVVAEGEAFGHRFEACPSVVEPERRWFATATPLAPGPGGARWLFTNHQGGVSFTTAGPFAVDRATCEVPPGLTPLGR